MELTAICNFCFATRPSTLHAQSQTGYTRHIILCKDISVPGSDRRAHASCGRECMIRSVAMATQLQADGVIIYKGPSQASKIYNSSWQIKRLRHSVISRIDEWLSIDGNRPHHRLRRSEPCSPTCVALAAPSSEEPSCRPRCHPHCLYGMILWDANCPLQAGPTACTTMRRLM